MQAIRFRTLCWLLFGVSVASCTKHDAYIVDGVSGKFCVPRGYPPKGVWFAPNDQPTTPHGFSFMGCELLDEKIRQACKLPDGLIGASVIPLSVAVNQTWGELKGAALFQRLISDPAVEYEISTETNMLTVYNRNVWPSWFIWGRNSKQRDTSAYHLHDSDVLILSCSNSNIFPGGNGGLGGGDDFACERYVRGNNYAIKYKFISPDRVPDESRLQKLDSSLFRQVDLWKCSD
jgi:hypothetical protein